MMSRLTRDGTAETASRDQIFRRKRGRGKVHFPFSAEHVQDGQPYTVDPYTCYIYVAIHNVGDKPTVILYTTFIAIVVSHIQRIGRQPETLLYTVANPAPRAWSAEQGNVYSSVYVIPVAYSFLHVPGMYVWSTLSAEYDMDHPGVVASPARGHLK